MVHLVQDSVNVADRSVAALSQSASTLAADAMLADALRLLLDTGTTHLVVVASGGRFVGVLGVRQLVAAWADWPDRFATTPVAKLLDAVPPIVAPTATARTAACVMRDYGTDVVVIVGDGRMPVGLVTADNLVAAIADAR